MAARALTQWLFGVACVVAPWGAACSRHEASLPPLASTVGPASSSAESALGFEVFIRADGELRRASPEWTLRGDSSVELRVRAPRGGDFMVLGIDAAHETYQSFPDGTTSSTHLEADRHQPFSDGRGVWARLDAHLEFDETPGYERLVALCCPRPFEFREASEALVRVAAAASLDRPLPNLIAECAQQDIVLRKN